jgi:hypothetical protein
MQIKGSVLKARLTFVEERFLREGLERLLAGLPESDASTLKGLLATQWYSFALGERLDQAIVRTLANGESEFFERLGEASAEKNLSGVHKGFLRPGDPQGFLARAPMIYSFYYDTGRREYEAVGPKEAVLRTLDAETFSGPDCLTVVGWHRKALEMCGVRGARVVEEECRARGGVVCRYRLTWT